MNTKVNLAGVELKNPVMTASGTFGSGAEYSEFVDLNRLAGSVMPSCRYPAVARRKKARCQLVILPYVDMYFVFYANTFLSRYRCVFRRIAQGDVAGHDIVFRMPNSSI